MFLRVILFYVLISTQAFGFIRDYQTTRMISTSGAGTASILMIDAISLNPAASAFFSDSLIYFQQNNGSLKNKSTDRTNLDPFPLEPKGLMFALSDGTTNSKGVGSYQNYKENDTERTRYSFNMSSRVSSSTSLGGTYHYTQDESSVLNKDDKFHRIDLGMITFINSNASYGFSLKDVTSSEKFKSIGSFGLQYVASRNIVALADIGYNYTSSFSGTFFYKVAAQVKFFRDLSFRAGLFDDKSENLKGGSWGIMWKGPKFSAEFAIKKSRIRDELLGYLYKDEKLTDMSLSITLSI